MPSELFDKKNVEAEMAAKKAVEEVKKAAEEKKKSYRTLTQMYEEWAVPNVEHMRNTFHDYFGTNHELTVTNHAGFAKWLETNDKGSTVANEAFFRRCLRGVEQAGHEWRRVSTYKAIIHFPELTVRNIHRNSGHKMTDFWIKVELSPFLNDIQQYQFFTGMRTSFTLAEMCSEYNFSHLQGGASSFSWNNFCLGVTHFSTMCRGMSIEWNANHFSLWCQQLQDYLSWESLEGGPYKRFDGIHESGRYNTVTIDSSTKAKYYKDYLRSGHQPNINIRSNPYYFTMEVVEDDDLRKAITKVVTEQRHLQNWDVERKTASDTSISNRRELVEDYERRYAHRQLFNFQDKPVKFRITDGPVKEEKETKAKVAHQSIISYVVGTLNKALLKNLKHEFSKERRRYVAG